MKKLMIAAVAMAAGVVFADGEIQSKNIVGYQGLATSANCYHMLIPTFLNTAESNKCTLADLTVTGYTAPKQSKGSWTLGCRAGEFSMKKLGLSGATEAQYHYLDDGTHAAGWYASSAGAAIEGGASSVEITSGRGLWVDSKKGYSLQPAGAVNENDIVFQTAVNCYYPVGNATPVDIELSDLSVTGYSQPKQSKGSWTLGCRAGEFSMKKLGTDGSTLAQFHYLDDGVHQGWYSSSAGTTPTNETIKAGAGFWLDSKKGYSLVIPAPELSK